MYEATTILALAMLAGLAAYLLIESAYELRPPVASGGRRDIVNAVAALVAAILLIITAAFVIKSSF